MSLNVKIITLGCPKNLVDSDQIMHYLKADGYITVDDISQADIIIINTCGFIEDAKRESITTILEAAQWKEKGNCKYLVAVGCLVQKYAQELMAEIPEIDVAIGTGDIPSLPQALSSLGTQKKACIITDPNNFLFNEDYSVPLGDRGHYAYIKIAEGCYNRCSFCVIPSLRGNYRSRKKEAIVHEASELAHKGVKEIILVAQDTTLYGIDIYGKSNLPQLLKELAQIPELERLRLLYCYPNYITDELLQMIKEETKICPYLDIPLQHISDHILKDMGRPMNKQKTRELIERIRSIVPEMTLRSTFIVGFPGETEEDFAELLEFLQEVEFDRAGFFSYSREADTPAGHMPLQIPEEIKLQRLERARALQEKILAKKQEQLIGKKIQIIVDGASTDYEGKWEGRTCGDAPEIDGVVYFDSDGKLCPGDIITVKITHSLEFSLLGEICRELG